MKVCPSCQRINADDAVACLGCRADVSRAAVRAGGPNVSMFGSSPRQSGAKPLSEDRAPSNASSSYGAAEGASRGYVSAAEAAKREEPKGVAFKAKKSSPKKPWEK